MSKDLKELFASENRKLSNNHAKKFELLLDKELPKKKVLNLYQYAIAASLALLFGLSGWYYYWNTYKTTNTNYHANTAYNQQQALLQLDILEYSTESYDNELLELCYSQLEDLEENIASIQTADIKDIECSLVHHLNQRLEDNKYQNELLLNNIMLQ